METRIEITESVLLLEAGFEPFILNSSLMSPDSPFTECQMKVFGSQCCGKATGPDLQKRL